MGDHYQLTQCVYTYHNNIKITGIVTCWVIPHQNLPIRHIRPVKRSSDELFPCIYFVVVIKCNNIFWNRRYFNVTTIYDWPMDYILYPEYKSSLSSCFLVTPVQRLLGDHVHHCIIYRESCVHCSFVTTNSTWFDIKGLIPYGITLTNNRKHVISFHV